MRSTFLGFNTATSGLFASQRALDTTGHNIANVNTPGYTRQRVEQSNADGWRIGGGKGVLGTGVQTTGIEQMRNEFLDFRYRFEVNNMAYWEARRDGLSFIEASFNEPSETGMLSNVDNFFNSLQELSKEQNADELTHRALVYDQSEALAGSISHQYDQLEKMVVDVNEEIKTTVDTINLYAEQIASLNEQIFRYEVDGSSANDLKDRRNLLIDELSELVKVDVKMVTDPRDTSPNAPQKMVLQIAGQPLVYHGKAYQLDASEKEKSDFFDDMGVDMEINRVQWADGSYLNPDSLEGELKALIELRDGNTAQKKGIPYYISKLNEFAQTLAKEINEVAKTGYGLKGEILRDSDGNPLGDDTNGAGYLMFTANGQTSAEMYDENGNVMHTAINAKNIGVSMDMQDLNKIPAAGSPDALPGDASVVMEMLELRNKDSMFAEGRPEDFLRTLVANLGVDQQQAMRNAENQQVLTQQINYQRMSYSGVSQDEELANMVKFQHAYNASARMITTMDEMLDVVINRVGLVGR
ncbi:flagellar hook-associated protein FlgK [Tindallia californiensis]|uniref:Flagellar hook-associated protein 1 n=1 Tax=Tindallia californiensis TaxID=159292 RepID=A0A1H3LCK0_9FIRM|nr:flagellar hook-associated protein FlgK [Tindallia californiensis]SDY62040.1 flagellar hook-associated protein 1 FlgK [Tindallia californiensis]